MFRSEFVFTGDTSNDIHSRERLIVPQTSDGANAKKVSAVNSCIKKKKKKKINKNIEFQY